MVILIGSQLFQISKSLVGKKTAVVSTINGDANVPFYKELGNQGISSEDIPVVAFSVGEEELSGLDTKPLVGHLAAWNYFQSVENDANSAFIKQWKAHTSEERVTNDPMEATYIGFNMWANAVTKAGTTEVDAVEQAMIGSKITVSLKLFGKQMVLLQAMRGLISYRVLKALFLIGLHQLSAATTTLKLKSVSLLNKLSDYWLGAPILRSPS